MKFLVLYITLSFFYSICQGQELYRESKLNLERMLDGTEALDLQKAVYIVENAYYNGKLNQQLFNNQIEGYAAFCKSIMQSGNIFYKGKNDEQSAKAQCAVFVFMTDSIPMQWHDSILWHSPFSYNFDDYLGEKEWSNTFVSTLMKTKEGNCHSLPILYKLIMDKLGERCWLSLAPNHMYIKAWNERAGWYNIELTCGDFPTDAWLTASGYVHLDAIRNGIYMDTLSLKQSVCLCLVDLALGYMHKYETENRQFTSDCCEIALKYYPNCINALLLKAEVIVQAYKQEKNPETLQVLKDEMNSIYSLIHGLGYRKIPLEMYQNWLYSLNKNREQYREKKITIYRFK